MSYSNWPQSQTQGHFYTRDFWQTNCDFTKSKQQLGRKNLWQTNLLLVRDKSFFSLSLIDQMNITSG